MKKILIINVVYLAIIGVLSFWFFTSEKVACAPCPKSNQETTAVTPTVEVGENNQEVILFERTNIYACGFTDKAVFNLEKDAFVTKVRTWFSWAPGETELEYKLTKGEEITNEGILKRAECDPYQGQWCNAIDATFNKDLTAGDYSLEVPAGKVCQNTQSEGKGMIAIFGYFK